MSYLTDPKIHSRWQSSASVARTICLAAVFLTGSEAHAQNQSVQIPQHATLESDGNTIKLSATGAWPAIQILNRLRREYGWVVDYEESPQSPANLIRRPDGRVSPKIRTLEAQLTKPKTGASTEEWATLTELAKAFNQADREDHKLVKNGDADRFDLVPTGKGVTPILDTIVTLKPINRTAGESIDALLQAVQAATQQRIEVGGLASPGLTNTYVTVGGTHPARVFLAEILDSLSSRKVWLVTYDPEAAHYVISIETAVRAALTSSGKTLVTPIRPDRR